ncbi:C2 calcium-dependent domain-containing protein 4D [Rhineura floridana]|uniref:C2 calcium-dependent domain-containing protein 4D n=1 Tax=Rhineura floridana TaxID=261503 RepID=UPI002AC804B6|nr:C2 calcium-dependent domain-containing protein 4D [Rhineura floridana]XP_061461856.1 C2 calcium-dependent domain-containing protein 4D [Rhineura floridana]
MFSRRKPPSPQLVCPNVLTPDRIPTFFIPPNLAALQDRRSCRSESPEASEAPAHSAEEHIVQAENSDQREGQVFGRLYSASSMPQLSGPMGMAILPESPHTRRRESLFHGRCLPRRFHGARFSSPPTKPPVRPGLVLDSDTASSTDTSPYSSPLLMRSLGCPLSCQAYGHRRRFPCRSANLSAAPRPSSLSTAETSSTDTSPSFPRREKEPPWGPVAPLPLFPLDLIRCHERLTKEVVLTVSKGGRVRLSSEYLPPQGRLRVRLVSAESFYPPHCDPRHVSCCVSLQLRPGMGPRQRSAVIKRSRNPIFNEDFFFEGVSSEELSRCSLRLKVLNKGSGMRRDVVLGECDVPLDSLLP